MMIELGEYLEETTVRHTESMLHDMLVPHPASVWLQGTDGPVQVSCDEVAEGDEVIVNTGEQVPVDGRVLSGSATVNKASITGESLPLVKEPDDAIIAGSIVETGRVHIEAQTVGDETTTARIATLIRESLEERSETERPAQKTADRQVYVSLELGALTLALTRDVRRLSSVFLVDYACPLKLSAPVAIRATISRAVSQGVLIKGGPSIEKLAAVDT